jgi:hypothetical protein
MTIPQKYESAFDQFRYIVDTIRLNGTYTIFTKDISSWEMKEVHDGTLIGTVPYSDGTVFSLSVGSYEVGTSYPKKFGAHILLPNGKKCVWLDWNEYSNPRHQRPHVQFSENPKKHYDIFNGEQLEYIYNKLQSFKDSIGTLPHSE